MFRLCSSVRLPEIALTIILLVGIQVFGGGGCFETKETRLHAFFSIYADGEKATREKEQTNIAFSPCCSFLSNVSLQYSASKPTRHPKHGGARLLSGKVHYTVHPKTELSSSDLSLCPAGEENNGVSLLLFFVLKGRTTHHRREGGVTGRRQSCHVDNILLLTFLIIEGW